MADTYLKNLSTDLPALTDFGVVVGGTGHDADFKSTMYQIAKLAIETYAGTNLAGSTRSVQNAINALDTADGYAVASKGTLANNSDLNDISQGGIYEIAGTYSYSNMPVSQTYGTLIHFNPNTSNSQGFNAQLFLNNNYAAYRFYANGAWYDWCELFRSTPRSATYTINGVSFAFRRIGRIITVVSSGTPTNAVVVGADAGSATVSDEFKPVVAVTARVTAAQAANQSIQVSIGTNGTFSYGYPSADISTSSNIRCTFTYISAL